MVAIADSLKGRSFTRVADWSGDELLEVLDLADELKRLQQAREEHHLLPGRTLGMIFQKPSTRTRVSFEVGIYQLGGTGALPVGGRPPARARRDDQGHGCRPLPLPRRDHDPHLRAVRRRGARRQRVHSGHQRSDRQLASLPGARRRDDDPRALRPPRGAEGRLPGRRQQRVRVADGRVRQARNGVRGRDARPTTDPTTRRCGSPGTRAEASSSSTIRAPPSKAPTSSTPTSGRRWARRTSVSSGCEDLAGFGIDAELVAEGRRRRRSSCTACPPTTARRSPRTSSTGRSRPSGIRPRTACMPRRR